MNQPGSRDFWICHCRGLHVRMTHIKEDCSFVLRSRSLLRLLCKWYHTFDFIVLGYQVDWPVNIAVTQGLTPYFEA
ncbi:hypothetical protein KSP39_PZI015864 [Platanthera zijinensis]|uniref:Uncharacterized protein n=1 Tax=Platanthera zijinensis TaxID=2320716 RepID=A0AAP0B8F1_9ASPA